MSNDTGPLNADQALGLDKFKEWLATPFSSPTENHWFLLHGGPGVGKTYTVGHLQKFVHAFNEVANHIGLDIVNNTYYTAATNDAAAVAGNASGKDTTTLHKLYSLVPYTDYATNEKKLRRTSRNTIDRSLVVIDEVSQINTYVRSIVNGASRNCKFLLVGDKAQLLPVDGKPLIYANFEYEAELSIVERQPTIDGVVHPIAELGNQLRKCVLQGAKVPALPDSPYIEQITTASEAHALYQALAEDPDLGIHKRVLAFTNDRAIEINKYFRRLLRGTDIPAEGDLYLLNSPYINDNDELVVKQNTPINLVRKGTEATLQYFGGYAVTGYEWEFEVNGSAAPNLFHIEVKDKRELKAIRANLIADKNFYELARLNNKIIDYRDPWASTIHKAQGRTLHTAVLDTHKIWEADKDTRNRLLLVGSSRPTDKLYILGEWHEGS